MGRLRNEVDEVIAKRRRTATQSRADVLDTLTVEDWESAFPVADLCLRECIRFALPGAAFRKNVTGHDIKIDGQQAIPDGAFVTYLMDDVHFNEGIYSNPWTFDPGCFLDDRAEDRRGPHQYLGWGSGRHPCCKSKLVLSQPPLHLHASADSGLHVCMVPAWIRRS